MTMKGRDKMTGIISVNLKKIKATAKVNSLIGENYREEKNAKRYDNGQRIIDTEKTKDNIFLLERPADYDKFRQNRIERINQERSKRIDLSVHLKGSKNKLKEDGKLQAAASREVAAKRKLRADTVDTLGIVVQPSANFINTLSRKDQTQFFRDALEVMQKNPEWFGKIETAVIHYDENTPHMQCLATTMNEDTLTSDCQKIMGNKSKMSERQTLLANEMQAKGWDIERGIKRVDNPEYRNFKSELEAQGYKVTRYNDAKLMRELNAVNNAKKANTVEKRRQLSKEKTLNEREKELEKGFDELKRNKQEYNARQNALNAQIRSFKKTREEFAEEKEKVLKMANTASEMQRRNEAREAELDIRQAELDKREKSFTNNQKRATEEIQGMSSYLREMTERQLEETRQKMQRVEDAENFDAALRALGSVQSGMEV